jgi:glucose-6-phosphate isomerase
MKQLQLSSDASKIADHQLQELAKQLSSEITAMNTALEQGYDDVHASLNLPSDKTMVKQVKHLITKKQKMHPAYLIVVGIGGSNLGTMAVQEALQGRLYNQTTEDTKVLYADTVDADTIHDIMTIIAPVLQRGEHVLINGVSKSGGTTETIANFEVLIALLQKYRKDYEKDVVVTTGEGSKLWMLAREKGFDVLPIPKKVGGRYSVFSTVGLFPLGFLGIDIDDLLKGACDMRVKCLSSSVKENLAAQSACLIYAHHLKGRNIHDLFLFSPDLESVGKWYRQLMGESLGKEYNLKGEQVFNGITPTVSIGSTDLHSMAQLYLGGPYDKFTTFLRVEENKASPHLPHRSDYDSLVKGIQGKPISDIMDAILKGVQTAFTKGGRPFMEISLPEKSPYCIGQLLQLKMMEMMYLGHLMGVNPFDQPNVEAYKIETRRILEAEQR